uniref:Uncharacterized protein n=1 Tax=Candidatus Kentrum sp. UNK TaxID=2126344 RepID=A0A451AZQ6_9GAMM|nr:MAG: hypothetical protein BECKUNK1418G_GA0071005_10657 [Candidatus Kentron sp. UNK]VFK71513.1 MAG: hypothetical protein BECKUNK1418H_GA0071006_10707 [Candidatus Kentron sp. UNK]
MASFPKNEANMLILGREMIDGLKAKVDVFPNPPIAPADLENALEECMKAKEAAIEAQAAAEQATTAKNAAFEAFAEKMKVDLRYAEDTVNHDDAQLRAIGWGGRKPATAHGRARPAAQSGAEGERGGFHRAWLDEAGGRRQGECLPDPAPGTGGGQPLGACGDVHGDGEPAVGPATRQGAGVLRDRGEQDRRWTDEQYGNGGALKIRVKFEV